MPAVTEPAGMTGCISESTESAICHHHQRTPADGTHGRRRRRSGSSCNHRRMVVISVAHTHPIHYHCQHYRWCSSQHAVWPCWPTLKRDLQPSLKCIYRWHSYAAHGEVRLCVSTVASSSAASLTPTHMIPSISSTVGTAHSTPFGRAGQRSSATCNHPSRASADGTRVRRPRRSTSSREHRRMVDGSIAHTQPHDT